MPDTATPIQNAHTEHPDKPKSLAWIEQNLAEVSRIETPMDARVLDKLWEDSTRNFKSGPSEKQMAASRKVMLLLVQARFSDIYRTHTGDASRAEIVDSLGLTAGGAAAMAAVNFPEVEVLQGTPLGGMALPGGSLIAPDLTVVATTKKGVMKPVMVICVEPATAAELAEGRMKFNSEIFSSFADNPCPDHTWDEKVVRRAFITAMLAGTDFALITNVVYATVLRFNYASAKLTDKTKGTIQCETISTFGGPMKMVIGAEMYNQVKNNPHNNPELQEAAKKAFEMFSVGSSTRTRSKNYGLTRDEWVDRVIGMLGKETV